MHEGDAQAEDGVDRPTGRTEMTITAKHGFRSYAEKRVVVKTVNAEFRLESADDVEPYAWVWDRLAGSAVYGAQAHHLSARARAALSLT